MSAYIISKFELEGLSQANASEVGQFGIEVAVIEPGFIRANIQAVTAKKAIESNSDYFTTM